MCGLILEHGNLAFFGASRRGFPELIEKSIFIVGGVTFSNIKIMIIVTTIVVFILLETIIIKTKLGMAMRAVSYEKMAVPLMGIPVDTVIVFTFVLGSSLAALAGVLFVTAYPVLSHTWRHDRMESFHSGSCGCIGEIRGLLSAVFYWVLSRFRCRFLPVDFPGSDCVYRIIGHPDL